MIVWLCLVAYCAVAIFAPSVISALLEKVTGVKRYTNRHIRICGVVFAMFMTVVTVMQCSGRIE
jgi:hypothetical protein